MELTQEVGVKCARSDGLRSMAQAGRGGAGHSGWLASGIIRPEQRDGGRDGISKAGKDEPKRQSSRGTGAEPNTIFRRRVISGRVIDESDLQTAGTAG